MSDDVISIPSNTIVRLQLCTAVMVPVKYGGTAGVGSKVAPAADFQVNERGIAFLHENTRIFVGWSNVAALSWQEPM